MLDLLRGWGLTPSEFRQLPSGICKNLWYFKNNHLELSVTCIVIVIKFHIFVDLKGWLNN